MTPLQRAAADLISKDVHEWPGAREFCSLARVKPSKSHADSVLMRPHAPRQNEAARDAFGVSRGLGARLADQKEAFEGFATPSGPGTARPTRGPSSMLIAIFCLLGAVALAYLVVGVEDGQLHLFSRYPDCAAAGIDSAGNEGTCIEGPPTSPTTVNVVNRARVLHMPEYNARLLVTQIKPTLVSNAAEHRYYYPTGVGQLVSYKLSITNTGKRPLLFGIGTGYEPQASYSPSPDVELMLPEPSDPTGDIVTPYPPIIDGHRAPVPSLLQQPPIAPNETRTGWVSFIAPGWALTVITKPGADIDFYKVDRTRGYRGSIRLWK